VLDYKQAESATQMCISNALRTFNVLSTCLYRSFLYPTLFSPLWLSDLLIKLLSEFFLPQTLSLFRATTEVSSYIYFHISFFTYIRVFGTQVNIIQTLSLFHVTTERVFGTQPRPYSNINYYAAILNCHL
jgi:hypothetical protein